MILWIGAEIEADIGDVFRVARKTVEGAINSVVSGQTYAVPFAAWDCILIIRNDSEFPEIARYSKKKQDMDIRLAVEYQSFRSADALGQQRLVFQAVSRTLSILRSKGIVGEGIDSLERDLVHVGVSRGWLP